MRRKRKNKKKDSTNEQRTKETTGKESKRPSKDLPRIEVEIERLIDFGLPENDKRKKERDRKEGEDIQSNKSKLVTKRGSHCARINNLYKTRIYLVKNADRKSVV